MHHVYDVTRNGVYVRQIVEWSQRAADRWVDAWMPGCVATYNFTL
jgi:hypothetical protein